MATRLRVDPRLGAEKPLQINKPRRYKWLFRGWSSLAIA